MATLESVFVTDLYNDVLFRDPSATELDAAVTALSLGESTRDDLRTELITSNEYTENVAAIVRLYEGILGRSPDATGIDYWVDALNTLTEGLTLGSDDYAAARQSILIEISNAFSTSAEATDRGLAVAGISATSSAAEISAAVESLYTTVLGRSSDASGLAYWTDGISSGSLSIGDAIQYFTESSENVAQEIGYTTGFGAMRSYGNVTPSDAQLESYTNDATTAQVLAAAEAVGETAVLPSGEGTAQPDDVNAGESYTLTTGSTADSVSTTLQNDTINGIAGNSFGNVVDTIIDNSTTDADVANLFMTSDPAGGSIMSNIETVNVTLGGDVDLTSSVTGLTTLNVTTIANGHELTHESLADGTTINVGGTTVLGGTSLTPDLAIAADSANASVTIGIDLAADLALDLDGAAATEFEDVTFGSNGSTANSVTVNNARGNLADEVETFTVTGDQDFTINISAANAGVGDTSYLAVDGSAATGAVNVALTSALSGATFSAENLVEVDKITLGTSASDSIAGAAIVSNLTDGMTVELAGFANAAATDDLSLTMATDTDTNAVTVSLNGPTSTTETLEIDDLTVNDIEDITIESTGASLDANSIDDIIVSAASTYELTITGDKALEVTSGVDAQITTVDASANTAGVDLTMEDSAATLTFTGTDAEDRLDMQTTLDAADVLDGGAGSTDVLAVTVPGNSASYNVLTAANTAAFSNFEILEVNGPLDISGGSGDVTIDLSLEDGMNTVEFAGAVSTDTGDTLTVVGDDGLGIVLGSDLARNADVDVVFSINGAEGAGTNNTLNLYTEDAATADIQGFTATGIENLVVTQLNQGGGTDTIGSITDDQLQTITLVGAAAADGTDADNLVISGASTSVLNTIDASGYTGDVNVSGLSSSLISTGATILAGSGALTATGGAGADTITGGEGDDILGGGLGQDSITGGAGADQIDGGAGVDTIDGGTGADQITGGAGIDAITLGVATDEDQDAFVVASAAADRDVVTGFHAGATDGDYIAITAGLLTDNEQAGVTAADYVATSVALVSGAATYDVSGAFDLDSNGFLEIETTLSSNGDLSLATDGTELLKALSSTTTAATSITVADGTDEAADTFFLVAYQGGDAYIYYADDGAGDDEVFQAADISLVATLEDVAAGSLTVDNIVQA